MSRYKLTVEYDGSGFVGWQWQTNGYSVQQALEEAVEKFCGKKTKKTLTIKTHRDLAALRVKDVQQADVVIASTGLFGKNAGDAYQRNLFNLAGALAVPGNDRGFQHFRVPV